MTRPRWPTGSYQVYPPHGLARVYPCTLGHRFELLAGRGKVCVPTGSAQLDRVRETSTKADVDAALQLLGTISRGRQASHTKRIQKALSLLKAGTLLDLVRAWMIARCDEGPRGGGGRLQVYADRAWSQLVAEVAHVSGETREAAERRLREARSGEAPKRETRKPTTAHQPGSPEHKRVAEMLAAVEVDGEWYAQVTDRQAFVHGRAPRLTVAKAARLSCGIKQPGEMPKHYVVKATRAQLNKGQLQAQLPDGEVAERLGLPTRGQLIVWRRRHHIAGASAHRG